MASRTDLLAIKSLSDQDNIKEDIFHHKTNHVSIVLKAKQHYGSSKVGYALTAYKHNA